MKGEPLDPRDNKDPSGSIVLLALRVRTCPALHGERAITIDLDALRLMNAEERAEEEGGWQRERARRML